MFVLDRKPEPCMPNTGGWWYHNWREYACGNGWSWISGMVSNTSNTWFDAIPSTLVPAIIMSHSPLSSLQISTGHSSVNCMSVIAESVSVRTLANHWCCTTIDPTSCKLYGITSASVLVWRSPQECEGHITSSRGVCQAINNSTASKHLSMTKGLDRERLCWGECSAIPIPQMCCPVTKTGLEHLFLRKWRGWILY